MEKKHILVIDDQESMRSIIATVLKDKGYQVTAVDDGEQGLTFLKHNPDSFDLILADVNMPKIDGFELLKIVKTDYPQKPVIFLTGMNEEITTVVGEEYKFDGIIKKPFQVEEALMLIEKCLGQ